MKNFRSLSLAVISFGAASMLFSACTIDELFKGGHSSGKVLIDVTSENGVDTKSGARPEQFDAIDLSSDGNPLYLTLTKTPNLENPFSEQVQTKGQVVTTDNLKSYRKTFNVTILNNSSEYGGATRADYDEKASPTKWPLDKDVNWPDDGSSLEFWAYSYENASEYTKGSGYDKFTYQGPTPGGQKKDASLTSDFLMAHTVDQTKNNVPIHFYHALAAVRFNIAQNLIDSGYTSWRVRITGIKNEGEAIFTGEESNMFFSWTPKMNSEVTYEQELLLGAGSSVSEVDRTFFFVPQELTDVRFTFIIVNKDGKEYSLTTNNLGTSTFLPGYIYNYTVGNDLYGDIDVKVKEDFAEGSEVKKDVKVGMLKSSAAYVRVAVVANWYTKGQEKNKVVAPYTGEIEYNAIDWVKGMDGFYYYKRPILGYSDSEPLIKEFVCPGTAPASVFQLHLEMKIIAQAVTYDHYENDPFYTMSWAWGSDLLDYQGNDLYSQLEKL